MEGSGRGAGSGHGLTIRAAKDREINICQKTEREAYSESEKSCSKRWQVAATIARKGGHGSVAPLLTVTSCEREQDETNRSASVGCMEEGKTI